MKILYLYYNQPEAVAFLKKNIVVSGFDFTFVDDGSNPPLSCDWAKVLRIEKDIPWNQPAANNLAFNSFSPDDIVLRMDIDHYFNTYNLHRLSGMAIADNEIITFRRYSSGLELPPHPNIYLARVGDIIEAGGYNEAFCGNYGYDDRELMHRLNKKGFKTTLSDIPCFAKPKFCVRGLNRNTRINYEKFKKLIK
jgi:hypothetical protein